MTTSPEKQGRKERALRWIAAVLLIAAVGVLATACRGGDNDTPPPATIIRVTSEVPTATQPAVSETLPMPPTLPELPTAVGGSEPYPMPTGEVEVPAGTPSPIVYPDN